MDAPILSTAYWPPLSYWASLLAFPDAVIDESEYYQRQTYRSRCHVLSAQGCQALSIPVIKTQGHHTPTAQVEFDPHSKWLREHWRALQTCYNNSPFFLYYQDDLRSLYETGGIHLCEWNRVLMQWVNQRMRLGIEWHFSERYTESLLDWRDRIHPKKPSLIEAWRPYTQTFDHSFQADLSILDLIFNVGPETRDYLVFHSESLSSSPLRILR